MENRKIEVLRWWYGTRDYMTGAMLYGKFGKNQTLKNTFNKPGKEKSMSGKLQYEVTKAVGFNWKNMPAMTEQLHVVLEQEKQNATTSVLPGKDLPAVPYIPEKRIPIVTDIKMLQYPKVIRRLKMEYQKAYQDRSITHRKMGEVPEANTPGNIQTRADYLKEIKAKSAHMDYLYGFIKNFELNKVVPAEKEVWPPEKTIELPEDIDALKTIKKNLQTGNSKDKNLLLYQQKTKAEKESPMPDGAKRKRIESRIKKRDADIFIIDEKIFELENVG